MFYQTIFENVFPTGPGNVTIHINKTNAKNALVSWDVKSQEECSGDVVKYIVFYRKLDRLELWLSESNSGSFKVCKSFEIIFFHLSL